MPFCRAPGCSTPSATRYSQFCAVHRARRRRHGAPDQQTITKAQVTPYLRLVAKRREKNPENPLWGHLEARWRTVVDHAVGVQGDYERGRPTNLYLRKAALEVLKLAGDVPAQAVVDTSLAMFLLQEDQPRLFGSDDGFRSQLVRRVRALTNASAGSFWDHRSSRVRRVYRDFAPKAGTVLGQWLAEAFGAPGLQLARLEQRDREAAHAEREAVAKAIQELV